MIYIDVIVPLPLQGVFTYSVPSAMADRVMVGMRVRVPWGKSKTYVALVVAVHVDKPTEYAVKDILQLLDAEPVVLQRQLKLWQWISDYYMSPLGEVYKAALPAGLKAEDGYKPKMEVYVRLTPQFQSESALHVALSMLGRADKQLAAFTCYLRLSNWDKAGREPINDVTQEELMNVGNVSATAMRMILKRGLLETYKQEVGRLNNGGEPRPASAKRLDEAQLEAYNAIVFSFVKKNVTLLHGVTSSGKTEIYIHLIQQAIDKHEQVLYLLPEIALTVQIMERLKSIFGNRLGIYHSRYSDAERVEIWQKQLSPCPYDVILGARSAVFLPFQRLGLVIVDEEHETSFKQQDPAPRYHARNVAIVLAQMYGAKTLLGTATPCLESYHNAMTGKYALVKLMRRYKGIEPPAIQVVDIKDLQHRKMMSGPFSPVLLARVRDALERGEQAMLFQNRRGFAPMIECKQCGWVPHCQNCDVSLTLHRNMSQLTCHYCGFTYSVPTECPACGCKELRTRGYGTEKIEEDVRNAFPEARVARMDLDTTRTKNAYERLINDFSAGRTDILIGTQMITKGLDFGNVSVVGILNADGMMNMPDFRAYEHAYMMMAQVSGRAGRRNKRGLVVLQTKTPTHPLIAQVVSADYEAFYRDQMEERRAFRYPPFTHLIYVYLKHQRDEVVSKAAIDIGICLRQWFGERVLGPDKPAVAKVKAMNIRKIVLKVEMGIDMKKVREYLFSARKMLEENTHYKAVQVYFDVDPL